jgi:uncharacterized membrane protein YphA (DoxX/SURF4 family)
MKTRVIAWATSPLLSLLFRWLVGVIFLYAGVVKVADPHGFALALYNYHLLPGWMINPMAIILPWVEIMVGVSLLVGIWTQGGVLLASGLLALFACALAINLIRGLDVACGCFSTSPRAGSITWLYLMRDLALLGMGVHILLFDRGIASLVRAIKKEDSVR